MTGPPEPARRLRLPRRLRLRGARRFREIHRAGIRASAGPLLVVALPNDEGHPRLGLAIGRRVGTAPRRNRIKRGLREAFRHAQHDLPGPYDVVIRVRPHTPMTRADYQRAIVEALARIDRRWSRTRNNAGGSPGASAGERA